MFHCCCRSVTLRCVCVNFPFLCVHAIFDLCEYRNRRGSECACIAVLLIEFQNKLVLYWITLLTLAIARTEISDIYLNGFYCDGLTGLGARIFSTRNRLFSCFCCCMHSSINKIIQTRMKQKQQKNNKQVEREECLLCICVHIYFVLTVTGTEPKYNFYIW